MSVKLESHEQIETTISVKRPAQVRAATKRLHWEHHELVMDMSRVPFALSIPSGGTPDFATSGVKLQWSVRLAFLIIPPSTLPSTPVQKMVQHHRTASSNFSRDKEARPELNAHNRSRSFAFGHTHDTMKNVDPVPILNGIHHIMPIPAESSDEQTSYRGIPDLAFSPILFQSAEDAVRASSVMSSVSPDASPQASMSPSSLWGGFHSEPPQVHGSVVLMPGRTEIVECAIPIKVYPSCTPFEPATGVFYA